MVMYSRFCPRTSRLLLHDRACPVVWIHHLVADLVQALSPSEVRQSPSRRRVIEPPAGLGSLAGTAEKSQLSRHFTAAEQMPAQSEVAASRSVSSPAAIASADRLRLDDRGRRPSPCPAARGPPQAELRALLEPALGLRRRPQPAGETDLAERGEAVADRRPSRGRGDRERDREVGSGLVDPDAAGDVDEDVRLTERKPRVPREHGDDHREPLRVDAGRRRAEAWPDRSARRAPGSRAGSVASPRARRRRPTRPRPARCDRRARDGSGTPTSPAAGHLEHAELVRRAEAVLRPPAVFGARGSGRPRTGGRSRRGARGRAARRPPRPSSRGRRGTRPRRIPSRPEADARRPRAPARPTRARSRARSSRASAPSRSRRRPDARARASRRPRRARSRPGSRSLRRRRAVRPEASPGRPTPRR